MKATTIIKWSPSKGELKNRFLIIAALIFAICVCGPAGLQIWIKAAWKPQESFESGFCVCLCPNCQTDQYMWLWIQNVIPNVICLVGDCLKKFWSKFLIWKVQRLQAWGVRLKFWPLVKLSQYWWKYWINIIDGISLVECVGKFNLSVSETSHWIRVWAIILMIKSLDWIKLRAVAGGSRRWSVPNNRKRLLWNLTWLSEISKSQD